MTLPPSPNPLPTTEGVTQGWKDIATAPRDGSWLMIWNGVSAQIPAIAYYDGEVWTHGDDAFYWDVTNWMPLPAPPRWP